MFFTPDDHIYGQWICTKPYLKNIGTSITEEGRYPSCAGLSAKYITEIRVYSVPYGDWTLEPTVEISAAHTLM